MMGWGSLLRRAHRDSRGMTFITAVFVIFAIGMMLFGFQFLNQNESAFAAFNRNSTITLHLAEAGIQEAQARLSAFGVIPGSTCFASSALSGGSCSGDTPQKNAVAYQATLSSNPSLFPIMSTATFGGTTRVVRVIEEAVAKPGFSNVILAPQVTFQGNAQPTIGDVYSQTSVVFASPSKSPQCSSGTAPTNLLSPEIMAGSYVNGGNGPSVSMPQCSSTVSSNRFTAECATGTQEVAPTPCARQAVSGHTVPAFWHPQTPIGMCGGWTPSSCGTNDFSVVINAWHSGGSGWPGVSSALSVVPAQQNGKDVSYSPVSYTPTYWAATGTTNEVLLVVAKQPFCVDPVAQTVSLPSGGVTGTCSSGQHYYGSQESGTPYQTRYLDWGLVQDDLSRQTSQTFFQSSQCSSCSNSGNQNGIRYVPILPTINVQGQACAQNVNPGTNVFDNANGDGISCANPPTTTLVNQTTVSFNGTYSNPEGLVIDNAGAGTVGIGGSIPGNSTLNCSNTNFKNYNWGIILATGNIDLGQSGGSTVFSGFIYTPGTVTSHGTVLIQGGIFSANVQGQSSQVNQVDTLGTVSFCAGTNATVPLSPLFYNFSALEWVDRPSNKP